MADVNFSNSYSRILGINNYEVLYSYGSNLTHLVKARYIQLNESHSSFNEEYHQTLSVGRYYLSSKLDDNEETIWFVFFTDYRINYFQYNATSFSLIGSRYTLSAKTGNSTLSMDVAGEIV